MEACPLTNKPCDRRRTIHVTDISNGRAIASVDMCEECGLQFVQMNTPIIAYFHGLLKQKAISFVEMLFGAPAMNVEPPSSIPQCPKCGWTMEDIARTKRMGCDACYGFFDMDATLLSLHGDTVHTGKRPKHKPLLSVVKKMGVKEVAARIIQSNQAMKDAVTSENYVHAAKMRDLVRDLSPILDLVEKYENKLNAIDKPEEAAAIEQQMSMLQQDYENILRTYA